MGYLNTSTVLLAEAFLSKVRKFPKDEKGRFDCPSDYKTKIMAEAEHLVRLGISSERMLQICNDPANKNSVEYSLERFISSRGAHIPNRYKYPRLADECISFGFFYFHPLLQETSKPPLTVIDWDTMDMRVEQQEPFYLEMVDSFRLEDVVNYFLKETGTEEQLNQKSRLIGQFKNCVRHYGLDMTLYLIDAGVAYSIDENARMPRSVGDLTDRLEEALYMFENRTNTSKEGGLVRVQPRITGP